MKNNIKIPVVILCYVLVIDTNIWGQETYSINNDSANVGGCIRGGIGSCYFGLTSEKSLSFYYNENLFTIRYLKADPFVIGLGDIYDEPELTMREIGILYGRSQRKRYMVLSLSGGISIINGVIRGKQLSEHKFEQINIAELSIPLEAEMRLEIANTVGIGFSVFANLNTKRAFLGGMLKLSIGYFQWALKN
jgi:hypothetical protein